MMEEAAGLYRRDVTIGRRGSLLGQPAPPKDFAGHASRFGSAWLRHAKPLRAKRGAPFRTKLRTRILLKLRDKLSPTVQLEQEYTPIVR